MDAKNYSDDISKTSHTWDYIAIGGIVFALTFLLAIVRPLLRWEWQSMFLSLAFAFFLAAGIPLFAHGLAEMLSFLRQTKATTDQSAELVRSGSTHAGFLAGGFVIILSFVGFAVLVFALSLVPFHTGMTNPTAVPVPIAVKTIPLPNTPAELYLDLLKKTLTRAQVAGQYERYTLKPNPVNRLTLHLIEPVLHGAGYELVGLRASNPEAYMSAGGDNSARLEDGETMVGLRQLDNMQLCVVDVLRREVPGDLIEAGAWRGGLTIFMRGVLKAYGDRDRKVWVADSFEGLPPVDRRKDSMNYSEGDMAVSLEEVRENFARYGLLDDRVQFLKGFFNHTLPTAPIGKLAILRVDADLYQSTMDALNSLYPKLSIGGYAIFDDYVQEPAVKRAIDEYRTSHGITEPIRQIDGQAVYWQRDK